MALVNLQQPPRNALEVIFSNGFRPLFLCVGLFALFALGWWIGFLAGALPAPVSAMPPLYWHGHEMLFGMVGAAIGGFLLAAVANWTGRAPVRGLPLGLLVACWLTGRVALLNSAQLSPWALLALDSLYWLLLPMLVGREIWLSGNLKNLKVVALLVLLGLFNLLFHLQPLVDAAANPHGLREMAIRGALIQVCVMITLIGGRITPAFTRNWLNLHRPEAPRLPPAFNHWDKAAAAATLALVPAWLFAPTHLLTAVIALLAGILQLARVSRWCGLQTLREPLLFVLHAGYAWLGIGFLLLGLSRLVPALPVSAGVHALALGAMAGLILAVAARAALGHTNRPLRAGPLMTVAFGLIHLGAVLRVLATLPLEAQTALLHGAAACWLLAFALFCIRYAPILLTRAPALGQIR